MTGRRWRGGPGCKATWLQTFMDYPHGTPSWHTFRRVLSRLDPVAFEACLRRWMEALVQMPPGTLIAIDGKSLRQSFDKGWEKGAMSHMVSMYVTFQEKVLSQVQCTGKGRELAAIQELLGLVDIAGAVVTIDALGCQTEVAEKIVAKQADYPDFPLCGAKIIDIRPFGRDGLATLNPVPKPGAG